MRIYMYTYAYAAYAHMQREEEREGETWEGESGGEEERGWNMSSKWTTSVRTI